MLLLRFEGVVHGIDGDDGADIGDGSPLLRAQRCEVQHVALHGLDADIVLLHAAQTWVRQPAQQRAALRGGAHERLLSQIGGGVARRSAWASCCSGS